MCVSSPKRWCGAKGTKPKFQRTARSPLAITVSAEYGKYSILLNYSECVIGFIFPHPPEDLEKKKEEKVSCEVDKFGSILIFGSCVIHRPLVFTDALSFKNMFLKRDKKCASAVTSTNKDFDRNSALQAACDISIWIPQMSDFVPRNAGYTVSVRRIRLDVLILLTLALAGESPTCILHEGIHLVTRAIEVSHAACKES